MYNTLKLLSGSPSGYSGKETASWRHLEHALDQEGPLEKG